MTGDEIQARTWALVATAADGRYGDVDALVGDLAPEELADVVSGLAGLAVMALMPDRTRVRHLGDRARLAHELRTDLLRRAAGAPDDAA